MWPRPRGASDDGAGFAAAGFWSIVARDRCPKRAREITVPPGAVKSRIYRYFVNTPNRIRTGDLLRERQSWAGGDRYATVQIARNHEGDSTVRWPGRPRPAVASMFGKSSDGPKQDQPQHPQRVLGARHRSHSAAEPRPSCSASRQHARSLPRGPAAPAQAPRDAHSSLIRSLRVWRREPEGPRALDGVCPAVGGDCRPRLCVPGSSSAGRATFSA